MKTKKLLETIVAAAALCILIWVLVLGVAREIDADNAAAAAHALHNGGGHR